MVKAQIHAGGRGKGTIKDNPKQRGVQLVKTREEAATVAAHLLGKELVTIQTGPEGKTVQQVLVEEGCDIARELYLGIVVDRAAAGAGADGLERRRHEHRRSRREDAAT